MIKTAGANVTPREVEVALETLPEVARRTWSACPMPSAARTSPPRSCWSRGAALDADDAARAAATSELAAYKVPRCCLLRGRADLPFTDSGKIDKQRLAVMLAERLRLARRSPMKLHPGSVSLLAAVLLAGTGSAVARAEEEEGEDARESTQERSRRQGPHRRRKREQGLARVHADPRRRRSRRDQRRQGPAHV